jgi:hemimethylated DNA binding protein
MTMLSLLSRSARRSYGKTRFVSLNPNNLSHGRLPKAFAAAATPTLTSSQQKRLSSSSSADAHAPPAPPDRLSRTLYRQLLQWCHHRRRIDPDVPLSLLVAPVFLQAPQEIDAYRTELLAHQFYEINASINADNADAMDVRRARKLLPARAIVKPKQITAPIDSLTDLKRILGAIYRLNRRGETEYQKQRITAAFEALKSLNQLSGGLDSLHAQRQDHMDRANGSGSDVTYTVGQVVQHRHERWRGVVAAWERKRFDPNAKTSLTDKGYNLQDNFENAAMTQKEEEPSFTIKYDIILDAGDAHSMASSSGWSKAAQSDLMPVTDTSLARIRSKSIDEYFTRFDIASQSFVPNSLLAYEYPEDRPDDEAQLAPLSPESIQLCNNVISGVQELASRLEGCLLDSNTPSSTLKPKERRWQLLSETQKKLARIAAGDVVPNSIQMQTPEGISPVIRAASHLRALLILSLETTEVMFQRRIAKEHTGKLRFAIGDIVRHKLFDFRGVVVAWDPTPTIDVTRWDGLGHVKNPMELPFYHVIPDQGDCVEVFGGERPVRYVCEENLEECPANRKLIGVDLRPEWERDVSDGSYIPPAELKFKYGEDLQDDGATEQCLYRMLDEIAKWHLGARESTIDDPTVEKLSLKNLLALLHNVDNLSDAMAVQETIKEMRNANPRRDLRWQLDKAVGEMMGGKSDQALASLQTLVEEDPEYAEAWNKLATTEFLAGNLDASLEATEKALAIDPMHFQALNGLGLVYFQKEDYRSAIDSFRRSISIDPWSAVPSKLSVSIDLLAQRGEIDEGVTSTIDT